MSVNFPSLTSSQQKDVLTVGAAVVGFYVAKAIIAVVSNVAFAALAMAAVYQASRSPEKYMQGSLLENIKNLVVDTAKLISDLLKKNEPWSKLA